MKKGDLIGMGRGKYPIDLYVEVLDVTEQGFLGWVINGAWKFDMNLVSGGMTIFSPFGSSVQSGYKLTYLNPLPQSIRDKDYNEVMAYMEAQLSARPAVRLWNQFKVRLYLGIRAPYNAVQKFTSRFKKASKAFTTVWGNSGTPSSFDEFDDDIAF